MGSFKHSFYFCLLLGSVSLIRSQTLTRLSDSAEAVGTDHTGRIVSFTAIGSGTGAARPRPWICYTVDASNVEWQFPNGSIVEDQTHTDRLFVATNTELFTRVFRYRVALYRGPDYNSPEGKYCCVRTTTNERKCVTFISCPTLSAQYADRNVTYNADTNTASYMCIIGYKPSGVTPTERVCQKDTMQWKTEEPTCEPTNITCPALPDITNGMVDRYSSSATEPYGYIYGTIATYECNMGYELTSGDSVRTCTGDTVGEWSGSVPVCLAMDCGPLDAPAHGQVNLNTGTTTFNSLASYRCNSCSTIDGVSTRVCGVNGEWSPKAPTCEVVDCRLPPTPRNGLVSVFPNTECNSVATYSCDSGYDLVGSNSRMCQTNGEWSMETHIAICRAVDCGPLSDPLNGAVDTSVGTTFLKVATYSCNSGYFRIGPQTRRCGADRQWTETTPSCPPVDCGSLTAPVNGKVVTSSGTTFMNLAAYSCNTGYNLVGVGTRMCIADGYWSPVAPVCQIADCGPLDDFDNGLVNTESGTTYNSVALYTCNEGYLLNGRARRTCLPSGEWALFTSSCIPVDCGALEAPASGNVDTSQGTAFMNTAVYSCAPGYNLTGCSVSECLATGSWSCDPPFCADNVFIQLKFSPTKYCVEWIDTEINFMFHIMHSSIRKVIQRKGHVIPKGNIQRGYFSCYRSTTETTYRTTITGTERVSAVNYTDLIQEWVESEMTTRVLWYAIKMDKACPVAIASFDDHECE